MSAEAVTEGVDGSAMNRLVALEVMGWAPDEGFIVKPNGAVMVMSQRRQDGEATYVDFDPANSYADAFLYVLPAMQADADLLVRFSQELVDRVCSTDDDALAGVYWLMRNLTPDLVCASALAAVEGG